MEDILNTPDDGDIGYLVEVDLSCPYKIREETINLPFAPETDILDWDDFIHLMKKIKPRNYTKTKKNTICLDR